MTEEQKPQFNPDDRVYLKLRYVKGGNIWYPGYYTFKQLPSEIQNEKFLDVSEKKATAENSYSEAIKKQKISITAEKPLMEKTAYGKPTATVVNQGKQKTVVDPNLKVLVNSATVEELTKLNSVGIAIANKIVEARKLTPFKDIKDLSDRVSLQRGSWNDIETNILFG